MIHLDREHAERVILHSTDLTRMNLGTNLATFADGGQIVTVYRCS